MNHSMGMIIETLVAMLLVATIGYCMLLNSRLKRLKADEQSLKATIAELITATEIAERAIGGLKLTVRECNENLGSRLNAATDVVADLDKRLLEGDDLLRRLSRIVSAGRPRETQSVQPVAAAAAPSAPPTSPQAIVAAAQAFAERKRAAGLAA
ncbi:MAG: DUF6468 domain-containing protein [Pseudomonadota bacterium]